jgi:hypothetical protein
MIFFSKLDLLHKNLQPNDWIAWRAYAQLSPLVGFMVNKSGIGRHRLFYLSG